ncbi:OToPetrin-Like [Caenorhabditis elegans]|uniref:OToPetrin-Like n=1 Tax=Caenorhabditis elegans TaxID=6239 RepID=Q22977_CAEEL|nr:OToPetrin-Like [Caenorhabditis elegans]CCD70022.1 OToPetrin-Like [Caenorhabditis elegans]|eukprot:NP_505195.1 OToPetrin-Like [Caenorhabditis elegans]
MADKERLRLKTSIESTSSDVTVLTDYSSTIPENLPAWTKNTKAQSFGLKSLTALYTLILTIVAFIIEISPTWQSESMNIEYTIFCVLMYSIAILYFIYLYAYILYPIVFNTILLYLERMRVLNVHTVKRWVQPEPVFTGEGAGTLYLRLGTVLFGTLGSVLWGCEIFLCFFTETRHNIYVVKYILAFLFTYLQMHFLCCNSKIDLPKNNFLASFGMMHCVAVNLWVWFSLCLAKAVYKSDKKTLKLQKAEEKYKKKNMTITEAVAETITTTIASIVSSESSSGFRADEKQLRSLYKLGSAANFLLTTMVEFSLIAAAVYFIVWKHEGEQTPQDARKKHVRFDCKSTSVGIFAAIVLLIGSFISIAMHYIYNNSDMPRTADEVIGIAETVLFCVCLLAVFGAFIRMRKLQYRLHAHGQVVDEILLIVGLAGEIVYCSTGLDLYLNGRLENTPGTSCLTVVAFVMRIVQVVVQSVFILVASRLRSLSASNISNQPGKQIVTFLVVCNINLFIYHTFETIESNFGFPHKMSSVYSALLNISSPLVVFYRFHSSACLAEIWKHAYSKKYNHSHNAHKSLDDLHVV